MSKKPKATRHKVPPRYSPAPEPLSDEYQQEVDRSVEKAEKAYADALKRLRAAEKRRDKVRLLLEREAENRVRKEQLADLEQLVLDRLDELENVSRLMRPGTYRGQLHRPVPKMSKPFGVGR